MSELRRIPSPKGFPRKCKYCRETVTSERDLHTHMVTAHKG